MCVFLDGRLSRISNRREKEEKKKGTSLSDVSVDHISGFLKRRISLLRFTALIHAK